MLTRVFYNPDKPWTDIHVRVYSSRASMIRGIDREWKWRGYKNTQSTANDRAVAMTVWHSGSIPLLFFSREGFTVRNVAHECLHALLRVKSYADRMRVIHGVTADVTSEEEFVSTYDNLLTAILEWGRTEGLQP